MLLILGLWPGVSSTQPILRVIDGDTLELSGEMIRLHGIDAPERDQTCERDGTAWACAQGATAALVRLTHGDDLRCVGTKRDRYRRRIAVCWQGEVEVNRALVAQGWAMAYRRYSTDYVADERRAEMAGLGIWSGNLRAPWQHRAAKRRK
ncbi:MAG: thermonuclease family protein [Pseudomonadota bacterium]